LAEGFAAKISAIEPILEPIHFRPCPLLPEQ